MSKIEVGKIETSIGKITNSVGISHKYYYTGKKVIKYLTFSYLAYNAVDDVVECLASGVTEVSGKVTGPISPKLFNYKKSEWYFDYDQEVEWKSLWINPTVSRVVVTKIHIQYMDNTEEVIDGKDIVSMDDKNSAYYRNVKIPKKEVIKENQKAYERDQTKEEKKKRAEEEKKKKELRIIHISLNFTHCPSLTLTPKEEDVIGYCTSAFGEFRNDEDALLRIFDRVLNDTIGIFNSENIYVSMTGHIIGDCIEKEYSSNEVFMKKAVLFWKRSVAFRQEYQHFSRDEAKKRKLYVKKYSEKIRKYEPDYIAPKKAGCISSHR